MNLGQGATGYDVARVAQQVIPSIAIDVSGAACARERPVQQEVIDGL